MQKLAFMVLICAATSAGATTKEACEIFPISHRTVEAGSSITWNGERTKLSGGHGIEVGKPLPKAKLIDLKMKTEELGFQGKVRLISTLPSVDTPVCNSETRQISQTTDLSDQVERVTISQDLPYAQRRFAEKYEITNTSFFSDYRDSVFGKTAGLELERNGLLARAIFVVDKMGIVRYLQIVPEITDMPDLNKAYQIANGLVHEK